MSYIAAQAATTVAQASHSGGRAGWIGGWLNETRVFSAYRMEQTGEDRLRRWNDGATSQQSHVAVIVSSQV